MPRKKKLEEKIGIIVPTEAVGDRGTVEKIDPELLIKDGHCFYCGRDAEEFKSAKGDRNQFKFCSVVCYNKETRV